MFFSWEDLEFYVPCAQLRYNMVCTAAPEIGGIDDRRVTGTVPIVHLRQLLVAYSPAGAVTISKHAANDTVYTVTNTFPLFGFLPNVTTLPAGFQRRLPTPLEMSHLSYMGVRGSAKHRFTIYSGPQDTVNGQVVAQDGIEGFPFFGAGLVTAPLLGTFSQSVASSLIRTIADGTGVMTGFSIFKGSGEVCGITIPWRGP